MPADAGDPDTFAIGSVTFTTVTKFNQQMAAKFDAYVRRDCSPLETEIDEGLLADARHYFDGFTWVGEVKVRNCDAGTSKMRGQLAVTAALNFVHVLFGSYHTDRMMGAGSRMDKDRRAHMTMNDAGRIDISCSSSAASAVGFSNGWGRLLEGESMEVLLSGAGKSLEPLVNPAVRRPLGTRLTDAVGWFGDAVREEAPAAQIVKAVTALETLVMTDEHEEIASLLSARAAALCYDPQQEKTFEELNATMLHAYDMRSRLAHGSLSPLDAEVAAYAPECLHWAERVICGGLGLLESHGLLDRTLTRKQLAEGMTCLVEWAKSDSAARGASPS
jgi:Apea-like HEPN